jgi:hypothetical protein
MKKVPEDSLAVRAVARRPLLECREEFWAFLLAFAPPEARDVFAPSTPGPRNTIVPHAPIITLWLWPRRKTVPSTAKAQEPPSIR